MFFMCCLHVLQCCLHYSKIKILFSTVLLTRIIWEMLITIIQSICNILTQLVITVTVSAFMAAITNAQGIYSLTLCMHVHNNIILYSSHSQYLNSYIHVTETCIYNSGTCMVLQKHLVICYISIIHSTSTVLQNIFQ